MSSVMVLGDGVGSPSRHDNMAGCSHVDPPSLESQVHPKSGDEKVTTCLMSVRSTLLPSRKELIDDPCGRARRFWVGVDDAVNTIPDLELIPTVPGTGRLQSARPWQ